MYTPPDREHPEYPFFRKVNGRIIEALSAKGAAAIVVVAILGFAIGGVAGSVTHEVEREMTDAERLSALEVLKDQRAAISLLEAEQEMASLVDEQTKKAKAGLPAKDKERLSALQGEQARCKSRLAQYDAGRIEDMARDAQEAGISSTESDEELAGRVPQAKTVTEPVLQQFAVIGLFGLLPIGLTVLLVAEPDGGRSMYGFIKDALAYRRKQHTYLYAASKDRKEESPS